MHINLNGMKALNESRGHKAGDEILKSIAAKLTGAKRPSDAMARVGGDDFVCIITEFLLPKHGMVIAQKIMDAVSGDHAMRDGSHYVSCALGLVAETISRHGSPATAELSERMIQLASRAMLEAKQRSRRSGQSELIMGHLGHDRVH